MEGCLGRDQGSLFVEPLNNQEDFGINLWGQPSSECQEAGSLVPGLWAAVGLSGEQGCVLLPNTNSKHGEEMESECPHLYPGCLAFWQLWPSPLYSVITSACLYPSLKQGPINVCSLGVPVRL